MFKLSEGTAIALHAIIYINNKVGLSTVKEISEKFKVSDNHLSKVLQRFVKEGILVSIKGPKGGFEINPEYSDMTFMQVYEIFEGKVEHHKCLFNHGKGHCTNCIMSDFVTNVENEFINYMNKTKISDFTELECKMS